jgi:signal transduction histidine kinase
MEGKTQSAADYADRRLAHLAHELRTPLTAIIGYADAMRIGAFGPLDGRYAEYAGIIGEAGRHMLALAEDLLARARIDEPGDQDAMAERFDPAEPIGRAMGLMALEAEAAGVTVACATPASPLELVWTPRALLQVVVNLLANAIRHTPSGGTVNVTLEAGGEDAVELTVSDTGSGMKLKPPTQGMGLRLVRELVESRRGTTRFIDAPGGGTVVTIRLPAAEGAP